MQNLRDKGIFLINLSSTTLFLAHYERINLSLSCDKLLDVPGNLLLATVTEVFWFLCTVQCSDPSWLAPPCTAALSLGLDATFFHSL